MKQKQLGFTLIELIIVIVILGILAVTALPRFLDVSSDAKAADLQAIAGSMRSGMKLIHSQAVIEGQDIGDGSIVIDGVTMTLYNGYPAVDGSDSFVDINDQLLTWLNVNIVDRNTANANREAAVFFSDKSSADNQIYIFFSEDYDSKSVSFGCQIRYQNPITATPTLPEVRVLTDAC